jgi:predicted deacylase
MRTETIALPSIAPGASVSLTVQRFGVAGARPQVYVQASLHADEIPGMICAVKLRERLLALEAAGEITGEVVLVPVANPIGLQQVMFGHAMGRFALTDGVNFNREYPHLAEGAALRVGEALSDDPAANVTTIRAALLAEMQAWSPASQIGHLKRALSLLALDADLVLDLHCDAEGVLHLYTLPQSAPTFAALGAFLGVKAVLVAEQSGGEPFDEMISRPWIELAKRFPDRPIPQGGQSVTVELRGQAEVDHGLAMADADAIVAFLRHVGVMAGEPVVVPPAEFAVTPLESAEPLTSPVAGVVVFRMESGAVVREGDVVVDVVDPITGVTTPVTAHSSGVLFARSSSRFATPGKRLGKIAGTTLKRTGKLLSN